MMSLIDNKYAELGGTAGFLGDPTTRELITPNGFGHYRHFQIYLPQLELPIAAEVHGLISDCWAKLGWENPFLGLPLAMKSMWRELPAEPIRSKAASSVGLPRQARTKSMARSLGDGWSWVEQDSGFR